MNKRQFPASFWNQRSYHSHHTSHHNDSVAAAASSPASSSASLSSTLAMHANHAALTAAAVSGHDIYGHDPYNFLYSGAANSGADSAAWHNYMAASSAAASPYHSAAHAHRSTSQAMQDVYSVSRLNPQQYSSLFQLQSMRQAAQGAAGRIDGYGAAASSHSHYMTGKTLLIT